MYKCPYCFSKIESTDKMCPVCHKIFSENIKKHLLGNTINLSLVGPRKAGKTTYISILLYLIENVLSQKNDISYSYLDNEGFEYIFENINKIKNNDFPSATGLNFDTPLIVLFNNLFFSNVLVSFLDTPGELVENEEYLNNLDLSSKVFKSKNIFLFIDVEEFFEKDGILYTGFISRYLNIKADKKISVIQNIYLIFTKSDKIYNYLYKYDFFNDYLNFSRNINSKPINDFREMWEELDFFSKEMKKVAKDKKRNFINLLEKNFYNVNCFFVSALGEENKFNIKNSFGVLNPLLYLIGNNYYSSFLVGGFYFLKGLFNGK